MFSVMITSMMELQNETAEMQTPSVKLWNEIASIKHQLCATEGNLIKEENAVESEEDKIF